MAYKMEIKLLDNDEINFIKWDNCVKSSLNAIVYAETWYLDIVCPNWKGMVADDYEFVMPICTKKKWTIPYVYQPYFTQQLGLFSPNLVDEKLVNFYIKSIHYPYIEMNLNSFNKFSEPHFEIQERINYELDLPATYELMKKNYSDYTIRNLKKAAQNKINVLQGTSVGAFMTFYKLQISKLVPELQKEHFEQLKKILSFAVRNGKGLIYSAYSDNNSLLATAFLLQSPGRVILLAHAVTQEGREKGAVFKIIDKFILENAQKAIILDFEGSNIVSIAKFFEGFGAKPVRYLRIKKNKLHPILKLLKK